jgi:hypothetical protein
VGSLILPAESFIFKGSNKWFCKNSELNKANNIKRFNSLIMNPFWLPLFPGIAVVAVVDVWPKLRRSYSHQLNLTGYTCSIEIIIAVQIFT